MPKYTIDFEATWQGKMEVEANSEEEAKELFYVKAIAENELTDKKYYPYCGDFEITDVEEKQGE